MVLLHFGVPADSQRQTSHFQKIGVIHVRPDDDSMLGGEMMNYLVTPWALEGICCEAVPIRLPSFDLLGQFLLHRWGGLEE